MMKSVLVMSVLALTLSVTAQAKTKSKPKLSKEDARELCLTTKGAGLTKKELKKCTSKAMRTGKV